MEITIEKYNGPHPRSIPDLKPGWYQEVRYDGKTFIIYKKDDGPSGVIAFPIFHEEPQVWDGSRACSTWIPIEAPFTIRVDPTKG